MIRILRLWIVLLVSLSWVAARAQQATESSGEPARARLAQLALDAPDLQVYLNGEPYDSGGLFAPGDISSYESFPPGTYRLALAPDGVAVDKAVVGPTDLTLEADHVYTVAVVGQYADKDLRFVLIDETAAFPNVAAISSRVLVHNLKDAPNIDMVVDGKTVVSNLAYGEFAAVEQPSGPISDINFVASGKPETVIFHGSIPRFELGTTYFLGLSGTYPGEVFTDFFPVSDVRFMGELTIHDGGTLALETEMKGEIGQVGERVTYTLTLDQETTLDLLLSAAADSPLDALIRLYAADGTLIAENDELDFEDDVGDAGLMGQALAPGTYTVEAASWGDANPGAYVLKVSTAAKSSS